MHRFFLLLFMLACLLTGCSAPQDSDQFPDKSENLDAYFEDNPSDNEMGAAEFVYKTQWTRFTPIRESPWKFRSQLQVRPLE